MDFEDYLEELIARKTMPSLPVDSL